MKNIIISLTILLLPAFSSVAEVKYVSDHGFIVENKIKLDKPIELVWSVLINEVDHLVAQGS